ncbi:putative secretory component protein shr3 [Aspergillus saccharolyticus JOP 1030-1]|uniref:Shr3 amino acid permease chaperone n=1 Tax=Aspergillus saccharolyticus JOP 1030-1 TaxID=1450539 RepID=A0A318Z0F2_9EURO|nr:Shr3 amino acid permease chaperone [Aspergillus saccharolyticus JOP 1030-1]PYH40735.1 Shr3 amino acid permease chaperone [Aspergillus saccharolyticus JOP 1030-1]
MAFRNGSFATFLIVCPTSFFLGIIFSLFPYDYPILWSTTPTPATHFDYFESHLRFLHASPPLIPRILHIVIFLGLAGLVTKLYRPSESNMLFDGASLVLYMCGVTVYIANIVKGLRLVSAGTYGDDLLAAAAAAGAAGSEAPAEEGQILGREDSLKVLAASNTILALVLVGVLVLQAGQWYAERKEAQEVESFKAASAAATAASRKGSSAKDKEDAVQKEEEQDKGEKDGSSSSATATATATGRVTRQASSRKKN